ncbi:MAG: ribosome small subunit-dependent GTPase A [Chitinispirillaceae bacterium]|nr:ribosome small subunit-dependent GTPase A [Chitinispirillaceae bacterium]
MTTSRHAVIGYDEWFRKNGAPFLTDGFSPARVIEVNRGSYLIADGNHEMPAELSGKLMFTTEEKTDFPTVGDWVAVQTIDNNSLAIIHTVLPRKTFLKRKEPGKNIAFQPIAANIDCGMVVQSADSFSGNRLDRYLVMLNECRIEPLVLINKTDLLDAPEMDELREKTGKLNNRCLFVSSLTEGGIDPLTDILEAGTTYCLLGPSGVGKTSLLNRLLGENLFRVNEVREKDGRGKHTTVRRQLVCLPSGAIFIDTPGMREIGNFDVSAGIEETFEEIYSHGSKCRFRDCTHTHEEGCAIRAAVEQGEIDAGRYQNYLKIRKETAYYDMSFQERRRKDRTFGKMIKNYKRTKPGHD